MSGTKLVKTREPRNVIYVPFNNTTDCAKIVSPGVSEPLQFYDATSATCAKSSQSNPSASTFKLVVSNNLESP